MSIRKSYSELTSFDDFMDRFNYLKMEGFIGDATFGGHRQLNQLLYRNPKWRKDIRNKVILRDSGCDLAHEDYPINGSIYIHHINPITIEDILQERPCVLDLENLVCVSFKIHNAIHFGSTNNVIAGPVVRMKNDTCPWRY